MPDPQSANNPNIFPPEPIKVTVISGTGDGRMPAHMHGMLAQTPGVQNPNFVTIVVPAFVALLVRAGHNFFAVFVATISAASASGAIGGPAILSAIDLKTAAYLAGSAVVVNTAKDCLTIFARLETKFPLLTGSV